MTRSGFENGTYYRITEVVLIPLLVDDPLWAREPFDAHTSTTVLIPLLVDDPLWERCM